MKRKKNINSNLKDQIEFGLDIGYFIRDGNNVTQNLECGIPFHEFNRKYMEYCK